MRGEHKEHPANMAHTDAHSANGNAGREVHAAMGHAGMGQAGMHHNMHDMKSDVTRPSLWL